MAAVIAPPKVRTPFKLGLPEIMLGLLVVAAIILVIPGSWYLFGGWIALLVTLAILILGFLAVKLLKRVLVGVGTGGKPRMGLILEWGKVVAGCNQGLFWLHYPSETVVRMRTNQYTIDLTIDGAWTKRAPATRKKQPDGTWLVIEQPEQIQRVSIDVTLGFTLPRPGQAYGTEEGFELLKQFYYAFPFDHENFSIMEELGPHLRGVITAAVINAVGQYTHTQLAKSIGKIEEKVKDFLLSNQGNLYKELGIPSETTDVGISSIVVDEEVEAILREAETIFRRARANQDKAKVEAETSRETADARAEAAEKLIKVYQASGVPAYLIPIMLNGAAGDPLDIADLRDLAFIQNLGN